MSGLLSRGLGLNLSSRFCILHNPEGLLQYALILLSGYDMSSRSQTHSPRKPGLHPRNPHAERYDLPALIKSCPELEPFVAENRFGDLSVDFADPAAVKALNKALLLHHYGLLHWDIPANYLCPPVPGRADYIHHLADLLAKDNGGEIPQGRKVIGLDIGTGANLIYPIVGHCSYGWRFVGTDIDPVAVGSAKLIADSNPALHKAIKCRQQKNPEDIFTGMIGADELFDFSLCNPPFHASQEAASAGTQRKLKNLGKAKKGGKKGAQALNFGGQKAELWCPGGELAFVSRMAQQSADFADQVCWFSSLVANNDNLPGIYRALKQAGAVEVETIQMAHGNKISRLVAWSFLTAEQRQGWAGIR